MSNTTLKVHIHFTFCSSKDNVFRTQTACWKAKTSFSDKGLYSQSCGFYSCGFSSCHVWMWELDHKKRLNAEELKFQNCGAGEKLLRVLWTAKSSSQSILKEINPEYTLEGLMLKLKISTLATWCKVLIHWNYSLKDPDAEKDADGRRRREQ